MAAPFEFSELQADRHPRHAAPPAHPAEPDRPRDRARRPARADHRAAGDPRRRREAAQRHQGRAARRSSEEFATPRVCQITLDTGEMSDRRPRRRQGARHRDDRGAVRQGRRRPAAFKTQGRGGRGVSGAKLKADDLVRHVIFTTAHAYLLFFSNLGKVYRLRAHRDPRARAHGQGHADRQPAAAAGRRDDPGDHRHPRLRRRALPVLRHQQGHGQEDRVRRVRHRPAATASSPSTCATATSWSGSSRPAAATTSSWSAAAA